MAAYPTLSVFTRSHWVSRNWLQTQRWASTSLFSVVGLSRRDKIQTASQIIISSGTTTSCRRSRYDWAYRSRDNEKSRLSAPIEQLGNFRNFLEQSKTEFGRCWTIIFHGLKLLFYEYHESLPNNYRFVQCAHFRGLAWFLHLLHLVKWHN